MWKATGRIGLVVVLVAGILAANAYACRIIDPRPRPRPWPRPRPAPPKPQAILTRYHSAEIDVKDQVATVTVNATFYNPNPFRMEGTYWFPLPAEASVKQFRMEINGKKVEGELLSADRAKKIYEDIVRKQKDPGLLEWVGSQMLKCRVYPMEPRKETKVELSYTHMLRKDAGLIRLDYPLRSAKPNAGVVDQLVVKVDIETTKPLKTLYCPTHDVDVKRDGDHKARLSFEGKSIDPKRDVQVVFSRSADDIDLSVLSHDPRAEDGYFLMMVTPKVEIDKDKVIQKDIVFVFDTSGSMNADNKIEQAKKALAFCVSSLNDGDRFGIVAFSGGIRYFRKNLVEKSDETVAAAREYIGDLKAVGGTAINDALLAALDMAKNARNVPMIIFLTDGNPTIGEQNVDTIVKNVSKANKSEVRLFVFGVGYDVNTKLLDLVAEENRGVREYVKPKEDIEVKVSSLYTKVANPVLSDVKVTFSGGDVEQTYPKDLPDLFHGSQLTMLGRFGTPGKYTATLTGTIGDEKKTYTYEVELRETKEDDYLPRMWALRKVAFLLDEIRLHGEKKELVDEVTRLGKRHGILTPYTSFLVVEEDAPVDVATRRELREAGRIARNRFADQKAPSGRGAVHDSADLARAKKAEAPAAAESGAGSVFGLHSKGGAGGYRGRRGAEREEEAFRKKLDEAVRKTIKRVDGKTFYVKADGTWVDSEYDKEDEGKAKDVTLWSDEFIELAKEHPIVAKLAGETNKAIVVLDGAIYRLRE